MPGLTSLSSPAADLREPLAQHYGWVGDGVGFAKHIMSPGRYPPCRFWLSWGSALPGEWSWGNEAGSRTNPACICCAISGTNVDGTEPNLG